MRVINCENPDGSIDFAEAARYQQSPPRDLTWKLTPRCSDNERRVDLRIMHKPIEIAPTDASLSLARESVGVQLGLCLVHPPESPFDATALVLGYLRASDANRKGAIAEISENLFGDKNYLAMQMSFRNIEKDFADRPFTIGDLIKHIALEFDRQV